MYPSITSNIRGFLLSTVNYRYKHDTEIKISFYKVHYEHHTGRKTDRMTDTRHTIIQTKIKVHLKVNISFK